VPTSKRWKDATVVSARASVSTCVKALYEVESYRIETIEELTDPEIVEAYASILHARQEGNEHPSSYVSHILTVINGLAKHFVERPEAELKRLADIRATYAVRRRGIAPRNRKKLQNFTSERIQTLIDMPDTLVRDINREVNRRRAVHREAQGVLPRPEAVYDTRLIQEVMIVLALRIMLARAPRRKNLNGIRLDWIRWRDDLATIEIPAHLVKKRKEEDGPLPIPLDSAASLLLKGYRDKLRSKILHPDDLENPYLFPSPPQAGPKRIGALYDAIPDRVIARIHDVVGVRIHHHLSRHLIGWIWLRENPDKLPSVQKLLGHKNIQTTIDYYAEIDESLALEQWQEFLNARKT
jgi:integrase